MNNQDTNTKTPNLFPITYSISKNFFTPFSFGLKLIRFYSFTMLLWQVSFKLLITDPYPSCPMPALKLRQASLSPILFTLSPVRGTGQALVFPLGISPSPFHSSPVEGEVNMKEWIIWGENGMIDSAEQ